MRRLFLPVVVLAVAIVASVLAGQADDAADPDEPGDITITDSLGTPLLSVRRAPEWLRQPTTSDLLDRAVRQPVESIEGTAFACLSVHIDGQPVTDVAGEVPLVPGSIQRLLTLAALDTVGTGGFTTEVVRASDAVISDDGVMTGDLYLIGRADPVLSTNAYISQFPDGRRVHLPRGARPQHHGRAQRGRHHLGVGQRRRGRRSLRGIAPGRRRRHLDRRRGAVRRDRGHGGLLVNNGITNVPDPADPGANVRTSNPVLHAATEFAALLEEPGVLAGGGATGEAPPAVQSRGRRLDHVAADRRDRGASGRRRDDRGDALA